MFSLQNKIRFYIIISIIVFVFNAITIMTVNVVLSSQPQSPAAAAPQVSFFLNRVWIFIIIVSLASIVYGIYVFVASYLRGLNRYRELSRRVSHFTDQESFELKTLQFPKSDEFGNIGVYFNSIISKLYRFDDLKVQRIKVEQQKFQALAEMINVPLLVVKIDKTDKIVKYYNSEFEKVFARKKNVQNQYYDLRNFFLKALTIQDDHSKPDNGSSVNPFKGVLDAFNNISEGELIYSFIDKEFDNAINLAVTDRNTVKIKKDVRTINGEEVFHAEEIEIIPAWDDHGHVLDVIILFNKLRKK